MTSLGYCGISINSCVSSCCPEQLFCVSYKPTDILMPLFTICQQDV